MLRVSYSVTAIVATGTGPEHIMQIRPVLPCKTHRESRRRRDHRVCPCVDCRLPPRFATARNESPAVSQRSKGPFIGLCPVRFREVEIESQETRLPSGTYRSRPVLIPMSRQVRSVREYKPHPVTRLDCDAFVYPTNISSELPSQEENGKSPEWRNERPLRPHTFLKVCW